MQTTNASDYNNITIGGAILY